MPAKIVKGQKLLIAGRSVTTQWIVLGKTGRRWAEIEGLGGGKIDLRDGWVLNRGGRFDGRWYLSQEAYQTALEDERVKQETNKAWRNFHSRVSAAYSVPPHATLERIIAAESVIFGESAPKPNDVVA